MTQPAPIGRLGSLVTRFAANEQEVEAAMRLRHAVFCEEMGASVAGGGMERDAHDARCRHLLVLDGEDVVGTYRLTVADADSDPDHFYSASEFDLAPLLKAHRGKRLMELGRSCIARDHRSRRTMELLWHGAWATALSERADVMFGCASFAGTDPAAHAPALAWLAAHAATPTPCPPLVPTDVSQAEIPTDRQALAAMPPLLKGYLRLGARVSPLPVIDHAFGTVDVLVVLDVAAISPRYLAHYGADASRFAA